MTANGSSELFVTTNVTITDSILSLLNKDRTRLLPFNVTFNNISAISWRSDLLVAYPEKTTDLSQDTDKLDHIMFFSFTPHHEQERWRG